jgi:hypothetical protein
MTRQSLIIVQKKASRKENSLDVKSHWLCHQSTANKSNISIMLKSGRAPSGTRTFESKIER